MRLEGLEGHSPVVLGEVADEALLGAVTLENLGLVLNPFDRTLRPMRAMLARSVVVTARVSAGESPAPTTGPLAPRSRQDPG